MSDEGRDTEVMAADFLIGERVVNPWGEDLGKIEELAIEVESGRVRYAVLSFGGVFGLGERFFALPWKILRPDPENRRFILDIDRDRLKNAPGFDRHDWPRMADPQWGREIHSYYNQTPYWEDLERPGFLGGDAPDVGRKPQQE